MEARIALIDSENLSITDPTESAQRCRICLEPGLIPIFGSSKEPDISTAVKTFGDIAIYNGDQLPKYLCDSCHELLQGAIIFRNNAQQSDGILRNYKSPRQRQCPICEKNVSCTYFKHHMSRIHDTEIQNLTEDNNDITEKKCNNKKPKTYKQYVCDKCGKVFKRPTTFKLHSLTHTNELKYKCMFCPYKGLHQALLKIHVRTHTGDYNYKCTKCPAKFTTKSNMNKHLQRHRGPIDFKCDKCKRGFYSKLELERHDKVDHLGIKNHICNICGLAFGYRNGMMNHQLKVHKREKLTKGKGRRPNYLVVESEEAA
ncbi:uncharacterized protein ACR2FA_006104 [Aphomia sociella]